jgi:hypothetical protein
MGSCKVYIEQVCEFLMVEEDKVRETEVLNHEKMGALQS